VIPLAVDDRIRAIDLTCETEPVSGSVIQVSRYFAFVWYDKADRERIGYPDRADMYYLDSGLCAREGDEHWQLQLIRLCAWCDHDISGPGEAHPLMFARIDQANDNWNCADRAACARRQDVLDARAGMPPISQAWRFPVAMLEAAS
jgi:hypothetical protein